MKKTKVLPFLVVKISFLLFLGYVGYVYMQTEASKGSALVGMRAAKNAGEWGEFNFGKKLRPV